jgi:hypothetical protein
MVFDPQGEARGVVWTPPGLDVLSIGDEHVLGVWRDELGLEYVRRYRIRREDGAASVLPPLHSRPLLRLVRRMDDDTLSLRKARENLRLQPALLADLDGPE